MPEMSALLTDAEAREILDKYVRPVMERILLEHIESDIYGGYSPKEHGWIGGETYHRRNSLLSRMALYHEINGTTIMVTSAAEPQNLWSGSVSGYGAFLAVLENGDMGAWTDATGRSLPRPAISGAQADVDKSREIEEAAERGFKEIMRKRR